MATTSRVKSIAAKSRQRDLAALSPEERLRAFVNHARWLARFSAAARRSRRGGADDPIAEVLSAADRHKNRVDLLIGLRRFPRDAARRRTVVPFMGSRLQIVGLEDFIAMKLFAGGPKDLDDVRNALLARTSKINLSLLRRLAKGYGAEPLSHLTKILADLRNS